MIVKPMKKILSTGVALLLALTTIAQAQTLSPEKQERQTPSLETQGLEILDKVAAIIDQDIVMRSELDQRINDIIARSAQANVKLPPKEKLTEQVLDQLVTETLQLSKAKQYNIQIDDRELNQAVDSIYQSRGWDLATFNKVLEAQGQSMNELRQNIRRELTMRKVSQGVVRSRIKISEQEIDNFLGSADAKFWISPEYHLGHILIGLPQSATKRQVSEAQRKALALYQKLSTGGSFAELAIAESDGQAALKGGDIGWRKSAELPTLFAETAPKLKVDEVSKPLRSQAGFHILKLYDKRGETNQVVTQTKARHILLKTSAILDDAQAKQKLLALREQIISGADFGALAKQHSEDLGSKLAGGDLGWSQPGMFVPEFEKVIAKTAKQEVSPVFRTQFGWHVLQVTDRRDEDLTEEAIRAKALNILTSRRFEDEVQLWLQEMKDDAYIEVKI